MLAHEITPTTTPPVLQEVTKEQALYAELKSLPDMPSRKRKRRIANKISSRQDYATFSAHRRALEIDKQLQE